MVEDGRKYSFLIASYGEGENPVLGKGGRNMGRKEERRESRGKQRTP